MEQKSTHSVTVEIDLRQLSSCDDKHLAGLWHLAQLNPAPLEDFAAAELVEKLQAEIVMRWLRATGAEMYRHQGRDPYWWQLTRMASFRDGQWVPDSTKLAALSGDADA